jgi:tetratricopeptide (TPR) repeat protein
MKIMKTYFPAMSLALIAVALNGCDRKTAAPADAPGAQTIQSTTPAALDPLALALVPHEGDNEVDKEIRRFQEQVRQGRNRDAALERLGWAFVAKAHESFDPGFYKLAEACADVLESGSPGCAEGLLLRGHVLQNLHRFKEAEPLARELVAKRGLSFDYGLLGDTLLEQGKLKEAVAAYQTMVDIRPDLQSYSRIAHLRWLTGDLDGAIGMMQAAANASSPRDADTAAWVNSRLANLQLQSGDTEDARRTCAAALELRPDYPPALLLRGKMSLTQDDADAAIADLQRAAQKNPLPEYQWALAEAMRAAGREDEAAAVEVTLSKPGEAADPRTLSLYLATRGEDTDRAVRLAEYELQQREDVFTHDALAWALAAAGRIEEARPHLERALAEGTQDARLFFHAAVIESRSGRFEEAEHWFTCAAALDDLLLPSEKTLLLKLPDSFAASSADSNESSPPTGANPLSASSR